MDHYAFLAKKFLGSLLMPAPLMILLLLWALLLMLRRKTRWFGYLVVLLGVALLFICSYAPLNRQIIDPFENHYPAYQTGETPADYIVVLGAWHQSTFGQQPLTSEIQPSGIVRLAEGIRIYYLNPGSKLVFTGYHGLANDPISYPEKLKQLAIELKIPAEEILTFDGPRDTAEEAQIIAKSFPDARLVLVTTAMHMPRAMGLFEGQGLHPHAAPTEHLSKPVFTWWRLPDASTLNRTTYWWHEQLGSLWARMLGQIRKMTSQD